MEILEIHAAQDLRRQPVDARPTGDYVYHINCRQFNNAHRAWLGVHTARPETMVLMTLDLERIWMTPDESKQVADAIKNLSPRVTLTTTHAAQDLGA